MERNYNNRDFEQFVKQNADQYRMFPSERVWTGINGALHTRRRWYGAGLAFLLLLTAGTVTWVMLSPSSSSKQISSAQPAILSKNNNTADQKTNNVNRVDLSPAIAKNNTSTNNINEENDTPSPDENSFGFSDVVNPSSFGTNSDAEISISQPAVVVSQPVATPDVAVINPVGENNRTIVNTVKPAEKNITTINTPIIDNNLEVTPTVAEVASKKPELKLPEKKRDLYPLSIESVVNSFKASQKKNKYSLQVYFTPTISYRKLRENKSYLKSPAFVARGLTTNLASLTDVNSVVTHKPDLGLEVGISAGYQATSNLKVKAGLQFNVSRYDIKAFAYNGEVITIALNNGNDSVRTFSNRGNLSGYEADWLQNLYFSVSAPIGVELKLSDNGKTHMGIAGTIQPTYLLSDRSYLISTDYKNYAEVPGLVRRLNLNTSFEAFISYSTGKLKWQVGPQFRYQLLSSFKQKYPVRENLYDLGLKIGIMLNH